ncbi:MAG: Gfo/Idh/MocA family oxidoreductase [Lachnospiraceae bacterium]|nr:Gfo/Idh/MocA family oxidoreductase [Lachnospiraceae bacterium]
MKIGIIGTGRIAKRFIPEALCVEGAELSAVYNPHEGSAERFVKETGATLAVAKELPKLFDLSDGVYIASPHDSHYEYIMAVLKAGKHVLCEKPMVLSGAQAQECFSLAEKQGLVLMEGIKTAYCPGYQKVLELAAAGVIGEIRYIDSCFTKLEKPERRELTDRSYGGSFTELGSYVLLPVLDLLGSGYQSLRFSCIDNALGIDIFTKLEPDYQGRMATAVCGLGVKAEGRLLISGTKGFIRVEAPWWKTSHISVHFEDPSATQQYETAFEGDGLQYEIAEFLRQIRERRENNAKYRSICMADLMERFLLYRKKA